jgi:hypothetical protein
VPAPALAQGSNCPLQQATTTPTTTAATAAQAQNLRFTPQQKQVLCQAAEALERHTLALTLDLTSALLPGTLGPVGPLATADFAAHTISTETGSLFDVTLGAATAGFAGSTLFNASLVGYLRAMLDDNTTDANYTAPAQPITPAFVFPSVSAETNPPVAVTFRALLVNEAQAVGAAQALVHALRRARGAAAAGNATFQVQHLRAAGLHASQLALLLGREPPLRLDVQGALLTERLPAALGDPALVGALQAASQVLFQFAATQGVVGPVPPPPLPANVPVTLPQPPPPPPPPAEAVAAP